ncbi:ABC transporter substrate-binding protein [Robinsoniella peoriensis]|uniref:ABC transporter substrate-binding protein n=1 Tax=Robinsoniella peoriensis TaxID=180332 RepID=UPI00085C4075|nr:extracellular solute-binding protein [Robinsoniella peoriensis]
MKKKRVLALGMMGILTFGLLTGCGNDTNGESNASNNEISTNADSSDKTQVTEGKNSTENSGEKRELSLLIDTDTTLGGFQAVADLAKEKLGLTINIETRPGGAEGDNIVKTRLASGDMADLCAFESGALLESLNPSEFFIDIAGEDWVKKLDETYVNTVSVGDKSFGVPFTSSSGGAVLYSKAMYKKYGLSVPATWDEFMANCKVLKDAGETAILASGGDSWTLQVPFLADNYSVINNDPSFVQDLEAGKTKWATSEPGLRSFNKMFETSQYYNDDFLATTYDDGCDIMANGEAGHWIILTVALSNIYELYGEQVNDIGIFAYPSDTSDETGLTVWMPKSIYGNKNSDKIDLIKEFMEFYISEEALDAYTNVILPDGPYCVKGYELPETAYSAVAEDMQVYFDKGKTEVALEFLTPVKGADCGPICQELVSGQTTPEQAAQKYDDDCAKMATQLGLNW